jgi:Sulfotransferase family
MQAEPRSATIAASAILIVGAPRSGTSWLGKIFDSHPDVLYRFEPDWFDSDQVVTDSDMIRANMARWLRNRDPRSAGKRPFFAKSWQTARSRLLRASLVYAGAAANRIGLPAWPIPDLGCAMRARAVVKSVRLRDGLGAFVSACPEGRALLILRHPCGQAASLMRGTRDRRFDLAKPGTDMAYDEARTIGFAAGYGIDEGSFRGLTDAAKYAWSWREFNETAFGSIADRSNARVVIYEDLCASPMDQARTILTFAGLHWTAQTETFLARSTSYGRAAGYYAVLRNSIAAADRWRSELAPRDQDAVRKVVRGSNLIRYWPDLTG